ncbi:hypothetical protein FGO68_gene12621 [Halteria grandinella]|uniref:Uncharacterized protein n=1 Tax=Halteria grandinella TaxID=5974 RepID=A0A8J8T8C5_HALGN|nr:hypothetical protein FGO68_gene12621 [Halteria grandinella]
MRVTLSNNNKKLYVALKFSFQELYQTIEEHIPFCQQWTIIEARPPWQLQAIERKQRQQTREKQLRMQKKHNWGLV